MNRRRWWGSFEVPEGGAGHWRIGPLSFWVQRCKGEWRIAHDEVGDALADTLEVSLPAQAPDLLAEKNVVRFGVGDSGHELNVKPLLADRPVVTRPERPFRVPPGEQVTVFVSSPLWLWLGRGAEPSRVFLELPITRPSDTWFGPTTSGGELCYASRTFFRLDLTGVAPLLQRARTRVTVRNGLESPLALEYLMIPVNRLELYESSEGIFWTQDLTLDRAEGEGFAAMRLRDVPPESADGGRLVAPARQPSNNLMVRAFSSLFA